MIREVRSYDAAAIAAIYNKYVDDTTITFETEPVSMEDMEDRIRDISSKYPYLVWEVSGAVVGYCYAHRWKEREAYRATWETTVYVAPDMQGKGVGRRLMLALIERCKQKKVHALIACVTSENRESIEFHKAIGFHEVSHFCEVGNKFGRWLDVTDLEMIL